MHLPRLLPFLGDTQFKVLCVIASILLALTVGISCVYVRERDPRLDGSVKKNRLGVAAFFKQVFKAMRRLPPRIRTICQVQFFAWIGWFPFLFYITTYIGQLCESYLDGLHAGMLQRRKDILLMVGSALRRKPVLREESPHDRRRD